MTPEQPYGAPPSVVTDQGRIDVARAQWHPTRNGLVFFDDYSLGSKVVFWWQCEAGHEWEAPKRARVRGARCPFCVGRRVVPQESLAALWPEVAAQLDPEKNPGVDPAAIGPGSNKTLWWRCEHDHEFRAPVKSHIKAQSCPYCRGYFASPENNLMLTHPELGEEWHPTANGELKAVDVVGGSGKSVWWLCPVCGHSWRTSVRQRAGQHTGCPACAPQRKAAGPLDETHPELVAQWHPARNGSATPAGVTYGSHARVWWQCEEGHEWEATVKNRARGYGCPYCSGQRASRDHNLAVLYPEVAAQWHPSLNAPLVPERVTPRSGRVAWWRCDDGHEWDAMVAHRTNGSGCPACAGRVATPEANLARLDPELAAMWDPERNGDLTPEMVKPSSHVLVWWRCSCGREWRAAPNSSTSWDRHRRCAG